MWKSLLFTSTILSLFFAELASAENERDLQVDLNSFSRSYAGKFFGLRVIDSAKKTLALRWKVIPKCATSIYLHKITAPEKKYRVDLFVDTNADFRFSIPPDRTYSQETNGESKLQFSLSDKQTTLASFESSQNLPKNNYSASLEFKNFDPHIGKTLGLRLVDLEGGHVRAETKIKLQGPCHHFYLENIMESYHSYRLDIFADRDSNGRYDGLGKDRSWILYFSQVAGEIKQVFDFRDKENAAFFDKEIEGF